MNIQEFHADFIQEILRASASTGMGSEDAFFEKVCELIVDSGELGTADRAYYDTGRGVRIDGYGGDPTESENVLTIIISDYSTSESVETLTETKMDALFKRASGFLAKALDKRFRDDLEETSAAFGVADTISNTWRAVHRVKLILITNRVLSSRIDSIPAGTYDDRPLVQSVWDIGRLFRYTASGREREDLIVDLDDHGGPVRVLPAHFPEAGYESYLAVFAGTQLASIYERWSTRLLEQNVRVFLQAKGGVNKGIKQTLETEPSMFFAYNNGLTATAERVETVKGKNGLELTRLQNFQIVNGAQTTASIFAASKRSTVDLSKVFVQVKLSVIPHERAKEVVPLISEYANSQNKVNAADFFANHPFHLRIKQHSERLYAPSGDGQVKQSKWFYERARGEYQDAKSGLTGVAKREFELEYPKSQIFTKTDLAKYLSVWQGFPHIVSKGAQTNFAAFAERIGKEWDLRPDDFSELYFREAVAKAIIFRETERIVSAQEWYEGAYRANVVAYAIAKLSHDVADLNLYVEFEAVWKAQAISHLLATALAASAKVAFDVITAPPAGAVKNVTEWAKRPGCWSALQASRVSWPAGLRGILVDASDRRATTKAARQDQQVINGIEAQAAVALAGHEFWRSALDWAKQKRVLSIKEAEIFGLVSRNSNVLLNEKQSVVAMKALERLRTEGFLVEMPKNHH
jgi:hypothetical protein